MTHPDIERVLLGEAEIQARIKELGQTISRDYAGRRLLLVGILKGSVVFLSDLLRSAALDCEVDFMCVSSYSGSGSTGQVRVLLDLRESADGKDLLIVEDIMDTGLTLHYLLENLKTRNPRSIEVCVLLDKPQCRQVPVKAKYTGFQIPNAFVVGFGLDYNERYRQLPFVGVLREEVCC
ncbi:MAG: hypoxanthine phosphoribosyltransferase [Elusimicrobia bacterium RIFCSPHIGHO2_02_FULL_57_9]|nr:MAG: hypoxanthine phosphoribosyltransferase [Elusimicrobia bacterium RIFCSPHIGHO2_02_FULL_57_9]